MLSALLAKARLRPTKPRRQSLALSNDTDYNDDDTSQPVNDPIVDYYYYDFSDLHVINIVEHHNELVSWVMTMLLTCSTSASSEENHKNRGKVLGHRAQLCVELMHQLLELGNIADAMAIYG